MKTNEKTVAIRIQIRGVVQGVGFRPHVYRLAMEYGIKGWVLNSSAGVVIEAEGQPLVVDRFLHRVIEEAPPLVRIKEVEVFPINAKGLSDFVIRESERQAEKKALVPPDIAVCADCRREVTDPGDRRYRYPFTNCTNCGPRFTIVKDVPYDRENTTMAVFPMCSVCREEYENPINRRFHAQPNACPVCGPRLKLVDREGQELPSDKVVALLKAGYIVAVKGLGGFHLACDATNAQTVATLRRRKRREAKPFAVMVRDLEVAYKYCRVNKYEAEWLSSPQAPIVILERNLETILPERELHPGISTRGVMLPYTPMHFLLFDDDLEILVMTSANISDEPLIIDNEEALAKLGEVADYFLIHNREIYNPCDDSVLRVTPLGQTQFYRRARGFVPEGIKLPFKTRPVLALGGEMKSTFCLTRGDEAFLSQHWGDLNHHDNYMCFITSIPRFKKMLAVEPEVLVHDLHPEYQTTRWARSQEGIELRAVQHHWAHMASCMAENSLTGEAVGIICDGTGWGMDGAVWGCEILVGDYSHFERCGHLRYIPLPGGDQAIKRPYRMAFSYLYDVWGEEALSWAECYLKDLGKEERELLIIQCRRGLNSLPTSSLGRLFDAVSAFLGICSFNRYEGQAAVELEEAAGGRIGEPYSCEVYQEDGKWIMDMRPLWRELGGDLRKGKDIGLVAARFHGTVVSMLAEVATKVARAKRLEHVVLSGGSFHNRLLLAKLTQTLEMAGLRVYHQNRVPPGDGGLSLGQAAIAGWR